MKWLGQSGAGVGQRFIFHATLYTFVYLYLFLYLTIYLSIYLSIYLFIYIYINVKLLTNFVADGIITSLKVNVLKEEKSACKNICLIDKTDSSNPTKIENYWMQTLRAFHLRTGMLRKKRFIPCWASPGFGF